VWPIRVDAEVVAQRRPTALNGVEPQVTGMIRRGDFCACTLDLFSMPEEVDGVRSGYPDRWRA
jgi:hypothetical protein